MRASDWAMERNSVYYQFGRAQKLAILGLAAAPFSFIQPRTHTHIQAHRTPRILMLLSCLDVAILLSVAWQVASLEYSS